MHLRYVASANSVGSRNDQSKACFAYVLASLFENNEAADSSKYTEAAHNNKGR